MNMNMKQVEMDFTHSQSLVGGKANLTMSDRKVSEDAAAKGRGGLNREQAQTAPWKCPVPETCSAFGHGETVLRERWKKSTRQLSFKLWSATPVPGLLHDVFFWALPFGTYWYTTP